MSDDAHAAPAAARRAVRLVEFNLHPARFRPSKLVRGAVERTNRE